MSTTRHQLLTHLDTLLSAPGCRDGCHNGCQVTGRDRIHRLATATTASQWVIDQAVAGAADALLVHHGLIWGGVTRIDGILRRRLAALLAADCSLFAYHLPLDAHPEIGNNALIVEGLGAVRSEPFGEHGGIAIGLIGRYAPAISLAELSRRCRDLFAHPVFHCPGHDEPIATIGVISGGGQGHLQDAAAAGCQAFITGEASEYSWHEAAETGCHLLACGHHATEANAIHALGRSLADRFELEHCTLDQPNPI